MYKPLKNDYHSLGSLKNENVLLKSCCQILPIYNNKLYQYAGQYFRE